MQRRHQVSSTVIHQSPRRPLEVQAIDMGEIWAEQQVENAKWVTIYSALLQGAMHGAMSAPPSKEEGAPDDIHLDYEALASEADHAYSRYAARCRNQRS